MQCVLLTIDDHDWYGPPQTYTRNDSSGLWTIEAILSPESPKLSSGLVNLIEDDSASNGMSSSTTEVTTSEVGQARQRVSQEPMEYEKAVDRLQSLDEFDAGSIASQIDGLPTHVTLSNDCPTDESREHASEELGEELRAVRRDSVVEHVVEPTLVMFEVT